MTRDPSSRRKAPIGAALPRTVHIHYLRPPDRLTVYRQLLVHDDGKVKVTLAHGMTLGEPLTIHGEPVLEAGSDAVWFTFPGAWHDIGRFHRADGRLTGIYANVITPCIFEPGGSWYTTDLFLDLWIPSVKGRPDPDRARLLDTEELERARREGRISATLARRAGVEGDRLMAELKGNQWPPPVVGMWTRARALRAAGAL